MRRPRKGTPSTWILARRISLGEFIRLSEGEGCRLVESAAFVVGPRGPVRSRRLERDVEGLVLVAELPAIADDENLLPDSLRRLCDKLLLAHDKFGLSGSGNSGLVQ